MSYQPLMKGQPWEKHSHKIKFPVYSEIKHDEIRMHVIRGTKGTSGIDILSYAGKPLANMDAWKMPLNAFMWEFDVVELDMGVEVNNNFNDSYRWVRSTKSIPEGLHTGMVKFHLYDVPDHHEVPYVERFVIREALSSKMRLRDFPMSTPQLHINHTEADLQARFIKACEAGYEGLMVKLPDSGYYRAKGLHWFKMKPTETSDGKITELIEAISIQGVPLKRVGSVRVVLEDGSTAVPAGIAHDLGRDMFDHPAKYIGEWVEFKYMMRDRDGGYRHPIFVRLREAKA